MSPLFHYSGWPQIMPAIEDKYLHDMHRTTRWLGQRYSRQNWAYIHITTLCTDNTYSTVQFSHCHSTAHLHHLLLRNRFPPELSGAPQTLLPWWPGRPVDLDHSTHAAAASVPSSAVVPPPSAAEFLHSNEPSRPMSTTINYQYYINVQRKGSNNKL